MKPAVKKEGYLVPERSLFCLLPFSGPSSCVGDGKRIETLLEVSSKDAPSADQLARCSQLDHFPLKPSVNQHPSGAATLETARRPSLLSIKLNPPACD